MCETLVVPARFRGPPRSGNGGYVSGILAGRLGSNSEVTLRRPVPLDRAMRIEPRADGGIEIRDGDQVIAEVRAASLDLDLPAPPSYAAAVAASRRNADYSDDTYRLCFVCGAGRAEGDGLRILAGPVAEHRLFAAPWVPHEAHADGGTVRPEYIWAALDCPGALAVLNGRKGQILLGRFATRIAAPVHAGRRYVVAAWAISEQGRKSLAGTALFSEAGELCAAAKATWIVPRDAS